MVMLQVGDVEVLMSEPDQDELLRRIHSGERAACEEFVMMFYNPVYALLFNLSRDAATAEDLTQETFARAWEHIGTFDGHGRLGAWLYRIGYNKFIDAQRSSARKKMAPSEEAASAVTSALGPLDKVLCDERSRQLHEAIGSLDVVDREVIVIHYLQGLSLSQTAELLEQPIGTVKWRLSKALERLRARLNGRIAR
jgi:RNA polymerase sigma-70 factor, ECF subfamily